MTKTTTNLPPRVPSPSPPPLSLLEPAKDDKLPIKDVFARSLPVDDVHREYAAASSPPPSRPRPAPEIVQPKTSLPILPEPCALSDAELAFPPGYGAPAPRGTSFIPFLAVTKFCYKYVRHDVQQLLATAFFDAGKIYRREWDLYYIWTPLHPTPKPVIFVRESQFRSLVDEMNVAFPTASVHIGANLLLDFDTMDSDALRPRFLGRSHSREQYQHWIDHLPMPQTIDHATRATEPCILQSFTALMQIAIEAGKNKPKIKRSSATAQHTLMMQDAAAQLLLTKQYLNLTPLSPTPIEDKVPILLAVDCEAHENPPNPITEIGIAVLDPMNFIPTSPNPEAKSWHPHIRARHFRTVEYSHLINHRFCTGNPSDFKFGTSEFVSVRLIAETLNSVFRELRPRPVVLVGHGLPSDLAYLSTLAFDPRTWVVGMLDTQALFRAHRPEANSNPMALGRVLGHFGLVGWGTHNAGNDAVYTLWALLAIGVAGNVCEGRCGDEEEDGDDDDGGKWATEGKDGGEKGNEKPVFSPL